MLIFNASIAMKLFKYIFLMPLSVLFIACGGDDEADTWEEYTEWREANVSWLDEQEALVGNDGKKIYTRVVPAWNENAYVLMRWFNDTNATRGNLSPLYTSTVDVKYIGRLYNDEPFDSSYLSTTPGDSLYRTKLTNVITGWTIAMERMHVGDSVELLVPYMQGYGSASQGKIIKPYSTLKFNIKLVNIAGEYIRPQ